MSQPDVYAPDQHSHAIISIQRSYRSYKARHRASTVSARPQVALSSLSASQRFQVASLSLVRVILQSQFVFLMFSSDAIVLEMSQGDQASSQRLLTRLGNFETLLDFFLAPAVSNLVDSVGRWPFAVVPMLVSGLLRCWVSTPGAGLRSYVAYRCTQAVVMLPFMHALVGMTTDLLGRGSDVNIVLGRYIGLAATVLRLGLLQAIKGAGARQSFRYAGLCNLAAFLALLLGTKETLPEKLKKPFSFSLKTFNPLSFITTFKKSAALKALGLMSIWQSLPMYNNTMILFRRHKHQWSQADQSNQMMLFSLCGLLESFIAGPMLRSQGLKGAMQWGARIGALMNLNTALSPTPKTFFLHPILMLFMQGMTTMERLSDTEARLLGVGQAELETAKSNLSFPVRLLAPTFFTELYLRTLSLWPGFNFILVAAIQLVGSELLVPWTWQYLRPDMLEQVSRA